MVPVRQVAAAVLMASAMTAALALPAHAASAKLVQPALKADPSGQAKRIHDLESGTNGLEAHTLSDVLGDLNHKTGKPAQCPKDAREPHKGFCWNETDTKTRKWWPQGLTHGNFGWLVSWHTADKSGQSRITLVNNSRTEYRHIVLVDPGSKPHANFKRVNSHVGGIAQVGHYLYVADSDRGLRVFDLNHIWKADGGPRDNEYSLKNGKIHAAGYSYALPQIGSYEAVHQPGKKDSCRKDKNPYFSSVSYDAKAHQLVSGEFCNHPKGGKKGRNGRLALWKLGSDDLLGTQGETVHPRRWYITPLDSMQGVAVHGDTVVATESHGQHNGHWFPMKLRGKGCHAGGRAKECTLHAGPKYETAGVGPEDVTYVNGRYWTLTEYPRHRWVFPNDVHQ